MKTLLSALLIFISSTIILKATNYTWTGSTSTAWNTSTNWSPNGVPDSADNVTIVSSSNNPILSQNRKISNLTMTSGTLDLNGFEFTVKGLSTVLTSGMIENGTIKFTGRQVFFNGTNFNCYVNATVGEFQLSGGSFDLPVSLLDTGYYNSNGNGGCIFQDSLTIMHEGTRDLKLGQIHGDVFNGPVTITNHSSNGVYISFSDSTHFNDNIKISSTNFGGFVFGYSGGVTYLADGKTISIDTEGFQNDYLILKNFIQIGNTSQTLLLTDTATIRLESCEFNGNLTITAPAMTLKNNNFNGTANFTRTGRYVGDSYGGNIFNAPVIVSNNGLSGRMRFGTTVGDIFNDDASFNSSGQDLQIAYHGNNYFYGDISTNSTKVVFNASTGKVIFAGSTSQTLSGGYLMPFKELTIDKSGNNITANASIQVDDTLQFVSGKIITTSTYLLTFKSNSKAIGANNNSFISGPVKKIGNSAFVFPIGKNDDYRPLEITAPSNSTHAFNAEFSGIGLDPLTPKDSTLASINPCDYWTLTRDLGTTSNVKVSLYWNSNSCNITYPTNSRVANWNGSKWVDLGQDSYSGDLLSGYTKGSINPSVYGLFILANTAVSYSGPPNIGDAFNYALLSGTTIVSDSMSFANGKIGSLNDVVGTFSNDSILTNNAGSVTSALNSVQQAIMYATGLSGTFIFDSLDARSFSEGVYTFIGNSLINDSIYLIGDTSSFFIFVINGSLDVDSGTFVSHAGIPSSHIYWIVNGLVSSTQNIDFPGVLLSKNSIFFEKNHNPALALLTLGQIELTADTTGDGSSIFTSPLIQGEEFYFKIGPYDSRCGIVNGCNQIQNFDFELNSLPPSTIGQLDRACFWVNPGPISSVSPDFLSSAATGANCSVPTNFQGCQNDHTSGSGTGSYAGIWCYDTNPPQNPNWNYREYLQQQLTTTLSANRKYYGEMYISLADKSRSSINSLGMLFTSNMVQQLNNNTPIAGSPQILTDPGQQYDNTTGWTLVNGCFPAVGNENYITIGNFNNNANTNVAPNTNSVSCPNTSTQWPWGEKAYYYIDDVTLTAILVDAGPDQIVDCEETVQLGQATCLNSLENFNQFQYTWVELQNPLGATLSNYNIYNPTVFLENNTGTTLTQVYQVTVTSPGGCSETDIVVITVESCEVTACDDGVSYCYYDYPFTGTDTWTATSNPGYGNCSGNIMTIEHELTIEPDAELTLRGITLRFGPNGKIIIKRGTPGVSDGGILNVYADNGTPSKLLPNSDYCMWQGIEIWGNRNYNSNDPVQGVLRFIDSELSYAHCGVLHGRRNDHLSPNVAAYDGGVSEVISRSLFKDNYISISFPPGYSLNYSTFFPIENNEFLCDGAMRDPIYLNSRSLYFIDINARRPNYAYVPNVSSYWIHSNLFHNTPSLTTNTTIAIRCNSCRGIPFIENDFIDVDRGIFFLSANGTGQSNIVTESNYFKNVNIGIYNRQNKSNIIYTSDLENGIDNGFALSQGIFNELSVGTLIQSNSVDDFFSGINIYRSGINSMLPVRIFENTIDNSPFSLLAGGHNFNTDWWCNTLDNYNLGNAWTLFDVPPFGGANNARIKPQGMCGGSPVGNTFNITSSPTVPDINHLGSANNFTYNIRTGTTSTVYEPDPVAGLVTVNVCNMLPNADEAQFCVQIPDPFRFINDILAQRDTTSDTTLVNVLNAEIIDYYIRVNEIDSAISFIDTVETIDAKYLLLDLYFMKEEIDSVRNILDFLPSSNQEQIDYSKFMNIMVDLMEDTLTLFEMDSVQLATMAQISLGSGEASKLAQGVFNTIYTKPINVTCEMINACEDSRLAYHPKNNKIIQQLKNYPNPCNLTTTFELPEEAKNQRDISLKIFNRFGKLVYDLPVQGKTKIEFNCDGLTDGLYLFYFVGANFKSASGKMVVIKN